MFKLLNKLHQNFLKCSQCKFVPNEVFHSNLQQKKFSTCDFHYARSYPSVTAELCCLSIEIDNCRIRTIVCNTFGILGVKRCSHKRKSLLFTHSELRFMTRVAGKLLYVLLFQDVLVEVQ